MVELAAFMVVCWMAWKFARAVWTNWATLMPYVKRVGMVLLVGAVAFVLLLFAAAYSDKIVAALRGLAGSGITPTPGLLIWGFMLAGAMFSGIGKLFRSGDAKPAPPAPREPIAPADFRSFMGMGR